MFEYHGWFNIREAPYFVEEDRMTEIRRELQEYITSMAWGNGENKNV